MGKSEKAETRELYKRQKAKKLFAITKPTFSPLHFSTFPLYCSLSNLSRAAIASLYAPSLTLPILIAVS